MGSSVKTVKLKIDSITNIGKIKYLELTKGMIDLEMSFYNQVILDENLDLSNKLDTVNLLEKLTHGTKSNPSPKYPLKDTMIPSPSITKRSIIAGSIGQMKSYMTRLNKWEMNSSKKNKPNLPTPSTMPTFYYSDFKLDFKDIKNQFIALRVFTGSKWEFVNFPIKFTKQFIEKYEEHLQAIDFQERHKESVNKLIASGINKKDAKKKVNESMGTYPFYEMMSPSLLYKKGDWFIAFPFEKKIYVKGVKTQIKEETLKRTLAVDLGINHLAVITIKEGDKLLKTEFISGSKVNNLRYNALKTITRKQKQSGKPVKGEKANKKLWEYVSNLNEDTAHKVSSRIVALAKEYDCQVVIFENLRNFSKDGENQSAKLNLKLNFWLHGKIVKYTNYKAYAEKILTVERSPFMSSQIHYKSNLVGERFSPKGENGKSLIMFEDKSILNADFNASMNMHRKFHKTFPSIKMKEVKAKRKCIKKMLKAS